MIRVHFTGASSSVARQMEGRGEMQGGFVQGQFDPGSAPRPCVLRCNAFGVKQQTLRPRCGCETLRFEMQRLRRKNSKRFDPEVRCATLRFEMQRLRRKNTYSGASSSSSSHTASAIIWRPTGEREAELIRAAAARGGVHDELATLGRAQMAPAGTAAGIPGHTRTTPRTRPDRCRQRSACLADNRGADAARTFGQTPRLLPQTCVRTKGSRRPQGNAYTPREPGHRRQTVHRRERWRPSRPGKSGRQGK